MCKSMVVNYLSLLKRVLQSQIQDKKIPDDQIGEGKKFEWKTNSKNHQPILVNNTTGKVEAGIPKFSKAKYKTDFLKQINKELDVLNTVDEVTPKLVEQVDDKLFNIASTVYLKHFYTSLEDTDKKLVECQCLLDVINDFQEKYGNDEQFSENAKLSCKSIHFLQHAIADTKRMRRYVTKYDGLAAKHHLTDKQKEKFYDMYCIGARDERELYVNNNLSQYKEYVGVSLKDVQIPSYWFWKVIEKCNMTNFLQEVDGKQCSFDTRNTEQFLPHEHYDYVGWAQVNAGKPMTHEKADKGKTNPKYNDDSGNYAINCQTCVVAYLLRRQGYNVEATSNRPGSLNSQLAKDTDTAVLDKNTLETPISYEITASSYFWNEGENIDYAAKIQEKTAEDPNGAMYFFKWVYGGSGGDGHIIFAEKKNDALWFYDPQKDNDVEYNEGLKIENINSFLTKRKAYNVKLLRVDDKIINPSYIQGRNAIIVEAKNDY